MNQNNQDGSRGVVIAIEQLTGEEPIDDNRAEMIFDQGLSISAPISSKMFDDTYAIALITGISCNLYAELNELLESRNSSFIKINNEWQEYDGSNRNLTREESIAKTLRAIGGGEGLNFPITYSEYQKLAERAQEGDLLLAIAVAASIDAKVATLVQRLK
jgi:hypothetical protein